MTDYEIIQREIDCVMRNDHGCDRKCAECDLVMSSKDILNAYEHALRLLNAEEHDRIIIIPEGNYKFTLTKEE